MLDGRQGDARSGPWRPIALLGIALVTACGGSRKTELDTAGKGGAPGSGSTSTAGGVDALGGTAGGGDALGGTAGGGDALGGTAGGGDAPGQDGGAGASELAPVRVIRGDPSVSEWWDLTIRGDGLTEFDGKIVTVRVGDPARPPERLGSGQARIAQGEFEVRLLQVWEPSLYKTKSAFVDSDDNGRCDPESDSVFSDQRGTPDFVLSLQNGPSSKLDMRESTDPDGDCSALNATWPTE